MHELRYRTRGNSDFKGKPKVFFTAHPDDHLLYFDQISEEILDLQNCAIWYFAAQEGTLDEEDAFNLSTMNLVVVPVSGRYLTEDSLASTQIIPFAVEHHISVLPIMKEPGISGLFQKKFQNMQYLIDNPADVTAIAYRKKLTDLLESVFWGNELADRIRASFDAYIFMSYRKKDRKYAQELMQLIHRNRLCRDIAIWYDEFLVPGEDFSQSIEHALEQSDLFALVVTPNLVNEENYVKRVEYPMAVEKAKPVLPVEMVPTSTEEMQGKYSGIAEITNRGEVDRIYERIKNLIPGILDRQKQDDPVHAFFMGLAYLSGIDVEVDRDRGVALITEAADAGLDEATEKLVSMYFYGDGVTVDYDAALKWQGRITDKYGDIAEKSMKEADVIAFLRHLSRLAELSYEAGNFDMAYRAYERLHDGGKLMAFGAVGKNIFGKIGNFVRKYTGHSEYYTESLYYTLEAARMLLNISSDLGLYDRLQQWARNAMVYAQTGHLVSDDERILSSYRLTVGKLGVMCLESGNVQGAETWFGKEQEILEAFDGQDSGYEQRANRAVFWEHMRSLRFAEKNYDDAVFYGKNALVEWERMRSEFRDIGLLLHMIESCLSCARLHALQKDFKNEKTALNLAKEAAEKSEFYKTMAVQRLMAQRDILIADRYMAGKRYDDAYPLYAGATETLTKDADSFIKAVDLQNAAYACRKLGDYYFAKEEFDNAMKWYKGSYQYLADVVVFSKGINDIRKYIDALELLFRNGLKMEQYERSAEWIDKACTSADSVAKSTGLADDIATRDRLFAMKKDYLNGNGRKEKRCEEGRKADGEESGNVCTLEEYEAERIAGITEKGMDEIERYVESSVGRLCLDFEGTHPMFEGRERIGDLGRILTRETPPAPGMTGKISDIMLNKLESVKYDEAAMIILSFCGFYDLKEAKHVIGGKKQALEDFYSFYRSRVFWKYRTDEVTFPELWCYMTVWIHSMVGGKK